MKENQVEKSNTENKMMPLNYETKVKFNVAMHGKRAGQEVIYGQLSEGDKVNVRRRLSDKDKSVEIVKEKRQQTSKQTRGASDGKANSENK